MRKVIIIGCALLLGGLTVYVMFNKEHRRVEDERFMSVSATELFSEFTDSEGNANEQYLDKVLAVTGTVTEVRKNQQGETVVVLATRDPLYGVSCTLQENTEGIQVGGRVTVKGICTGYLSDVVMTRGMLIKN